jgi:NAD(P)H-nitrite reductase large subunit
MTMKHVIIGNGIAGVKAAETIRREDAAAEITIIADEKDLFYLKPMLPDYVSGRFEEARLYGRTAQFYKKNRINTLFGKRVAGIDAKGMKVLLDGESIDFDTLLIASGADIPPTVALLAQGEGVYTFRRLSDARKIRAAAEHARTAVIIGDAIMGLELARALLSRNIDVTFVSENDRLWPDVLDLPASELLTEMICVKGVHFKFNTRIREIARQSGKLVGVRTTEGIVIPCDLVGVGGRWTPNLSFLRNSGIMYRDGVLVGRFLETNVPCIFAAGDAAQPTVLGKDRPDVNTRWHAAWQQGAVAAMNMLGKRINYVGVLSTASTQVFGVDLMSVGDANPTTSGYSFDTGDYPVQGVGIYKKLVFKDDVLVGALLIGSVSEGKKLENAVLARKRRSDLDKTLLREMFDLTHPFAADVGAICPVCKLELPVDDKTYEGQIVTCPACGVELRLTRKDGRWRAVMP